ncbi:MAG: PA0069 family radical SAM protein [Bacteroidetes bacterium]|nr:PA0069 family radical SAM protein [Bacteroidota bacterium]
MIKGRGAQLNVTNPFLKNDYVTEHVEGLDIPLLENDSTQYLEEKAKNIVNKVNSPDIGLSFSMNPYQGCEHGCIYCYARNTHTYYGYSAGLDFERKIIVKNNAPELLEKYLKNFKGEVKPIMFSGNTDCYQPVERKLGITRRMLEILLKYRYPVGMITKNSLILRDKDILQEMAKLNLVNVNISITTLDKKVQQKLEPRTVSGANRIKVIKELSDAGVPVRVMVAPIIPGINSQEIPAIIKAAADAGAHGAAYIIVRLNGAVAEIFSDWLKKQYPDRADKVLHQIASCHQGKLNDSRFGKRMKGDGKIAESIAALFKISKNKFMKGRSIPAMDLGAFVKREGEQLSLDIGG